MLAKTMEAMIQYSKHNLHDINHFVKVHSYARTIGLLEGLDERRQTILEVAAIVHDIACPVLREKYGKCPGKMQEQEGPALAEELLRSLGWDEELIQRVAFLVGHHHTVEGVDGADWQILLEADFLVNADEGKASAEAIEKMRHNVYKTAAGLRLLSEMYGG